MGICPMNYVTRYKSRPTALLLACFLITDFKAWLWSPTASLDLKNGESRHKKLVGRNIWACM